MGELGRRQVWINLQQTQSRAPPDGTKVSSILTVSVVGHRVAFRKCRIHGPCACVRVLFKNEGMQNLYDNINLITHLIIELILLLYIYILKTLRALLRGHSHRTPVVTFTADRRVSIVCARWLLRVLFE